MEVHDSDNAPLNASFHVEIEVPRPSIRFESRGGTRNADYNAALTLLLSRLAQAHAQIVSVEIETADTTHLSRAQRTVELEGQPYPISLSAQTDCAALRKAIGREVAALGRRPNASGGGNPQKQLRLRLHFPSQPEIDTDWLEALVGRGQRDPPINYGQRAHRRQAGSARDGTTSPVLPSRSASLHDTELDAAFVDEFDALHQDRAQLVFYGPPGTGKTWLAERYARTLAPPERVELVQFHPSYAYEDFVEGLRPALHEATARLTYDVTPGVFRELCQRALAQPDARFVLIIDEINRGNLPRIFGELLYLLDRRGPSFSVRLPLSRATLSIPDNLTLIGTMNTADQSIAMLDAALRRRFNFVRLDPDPELLRRWLSNHQVHVTGVPELLTQLNRALLDMGVDRNLLIGHSHFMRARLDGAQLRRIWMRSIIPIVEEHLYTQPDQAARFTYDTFVSPLIG